jgi:hypothetical protein
MTQTLLELLAKEQAVMTAVLETQRELRALVRAKDWPALEAVLHRFSQLSVEFSGLETARTGMVKGDFFFYISTLEGEEKRALTAQFTAIRRSLAASRAENRALNDYLRIMVDFLHGIFERAIPNRRAKVYTPQGVLANLVPTQLVVDCRG